MNWTENGNPVSTDASYTFKVAGDRTLAGNFKLDSNDIIKEEEKKEKEKAHAHTVVTDEAVEPTCTEPGLTAGSHCAVCGAVLTAQEKIPALDHVLVTWNPCGNGKHLMTCVRNCGYRDLQDCLMIPFPQEDPEAKPVSFCPVCGWCEGTEKMTPVKGLKILDGAPRGSLRVFSLEMDGERYLTVAFEKNGALVQPEGKVSFSLPEELEDISFEPAEGTEEKEDGTLVLDFAPEGGDPLTVLILKVS